MRTLTVATVALSLLVGWQTLASAGQTPSTAHPHLAVPALPGWATRG